MSENIPFEIILNGKVVKGFLSPVTGAGVSAEQVFHVMIDKFYWGSVMMRGGQWVYLGNSQELEPFGEYFGQVIVAWYE